MHGSGTVSVIIPVYNAEDYILDCLNSLLNQTSENFSLIIIDDGSTDRSLPLIRGFITGNPTLPARLIVNRKNEGEGYSRNVGLKYAESEFISFLDADDKYSADFIQLMSTKIAQGYDFVYCGFDLIDEIQQETFFFHEKRKYYSDSELIIKQYLRAKNHFSHVAAIYRASFLKVNHLHYHEQCRMGSDIEFICKLLLSSPRCSSVPQSLYYYFKRNGSITNSISPKKIRDCLAALSRVSDLLPTTYEKLMFGLTRKANMAFHLIEECGNQGIKKLDSFGLRTQLYFYSIIYILMKPGKRLKSRQLGILTKF